MSIEQKYIHNGALLTLDELHTAGILPSATQPTAATVYGLGTYSGQTAMRYVGSEGDCMVKTATAMVYYATQAECDAEWTTEEPVQERHALLTNTGSYDSGTYVSKTPKPLYDINGNAIVYDTSKTYTFLQYRSPSDATWRPDTWGNTISLLNENGYLHIKYEYYNYSLEISAIKYTA